MVGKDFPIRYKMNFEAAMHGTEVDMSEIGHTCSTLLNQILLVYMQYSTCLKSEGK